MGIAQPARFGECSVRVGNRRLCSLAHPDCAEHTKKLGSRPRRAAFGRRIVGIPVGDGSILESRKLLVRLRTDPRPILAKRAKHIPDTQAGTMSVATRPGDHKKQARIRSCLTTMFPRKGANSNRLCGSAYRPPRWSAAIIAVHLP